MNFNEIRSALVCETLDKYPDTATQTIARILNKNHPEIFPDIEGARKLVRYYRGQNGIRNRKELFRSGRFSKYAKIQLAGEL